MPSWNEIFLEVQESAKERPDGRPDFDRVRHKYIRALHDLTGRAVIVYASGWLAKPGISDIVVAVEPNDVHGLMSACHGVHERELDLVLHSPGGSPQAAEQMLEYLRTRFDNIRAIVPLQAKSAATMLALGCDEIVMGEHSELGPIDPQILIQVPEGVRYAPAIAILRDFQRAKSEIRRDVTELPAWTPILRGYAGGMIEFCTKQVKLTQEIVARWLRTYMLRHPESPFTTADQRSRRARALAAYFGSEKSYDRFKTHGRPIRPAQLRRQRGLVIRRLEDDQALQDAVLSLYHALDLTFGGAAVKIIENHHGAMYVRVVAQLQVQVGGIPTAGPEQAGPEQAGPEQAGPEQAAPARRRRAPRKA